MTFAGHQRVTVAHESPGSWGPGTVGRKGTLESSAVTPPTKIMVFNIGAK